MTHSYQCKTDCPFDKMIDNIKMWLDRPAQKTILPNMERFVNEPCLSRQFINRVIVNCNKNQLTHLYEFLGAEQTRSIFDGSETCSEKCWSSQLRNKLTNLLKKKNIDEFKVYEVLTLNSHEQESCKERRWALQIYDAFEDEFDNKLFEELEETCSHFEFEEDENKPTEYQHAQDDDNLIKLASDLFKMIKAWQLIDINIPRDIERVELLKEITPIARYLFEKLKVFGLKMGRFDTDNAVFKPNIYCCRLDNHEEESCKARRWALQIYDAFEDNKLFEELEETCRFEEDENKPTEYQHAQDDDNLINLADDLFEMIKAWQLIDINIPRDIERVELLKEITPIARNLFEKLKVFGLKMGRFDTDNDVFFKPNIYCCYREFPVEPVGPVTDAP